MTTGELDPRKVEEIADTWTKVQYAHTVTHGSMPFGYARMGLIMLAASILSGLVSSRA